MKLFRSASVARQPADAATFTGLARTRRLASDDVGTPVGVYHVEFEPGARTHWHRHTGPQWLLVVEGTIRAQTWGEPAVEAHAGDALVVPPGEKHWHGAAADDGGAHLAVNVEAVTEWLEPVADAEYQSESRE
jgi:4-carboxymuconolactone decarboxylase